jgi:hypothetical protein
MSNRKPEERLADLVLKIVETQRAEVSVSPHRIANEVMRRLDPENKIQKSEPLLWTASNLQFRQIARTVLAKRYAPDGVQQGELFAGLQWRYPTARSARSRDPEYVLRERMTRRDMTYNVERLELEGKSKVEHARALRAWFEDFHKSDANNEASTTVRTEAQRASTA